MEKDLDQKKDHDHDHDHDMNIDTMTYSMPLLYDTLSFFTWLIRIIISGGYFLLLWTGIQYYTSW